MRVDIWSDGVADGHVGDLARAEGLGFGSARPAGNTFDIHRVIHLGLDQAWDRRADSGTGPSGPTSQDG